MHHLKIVITKQNGKQSVGQGFSPNELKEAGVNKQEAKLMGFRVDVKRKSTHKENVENIKVHAKETKAKAATTPKSAKSKFKAKAKN